MDAAFAAAQFQALGRQVLILYVTISVNAAGLVYVYYGTAPDWLVLCPFPAVLLLSFVRSVMWVQALRSPPDAATIDRRLQSTLVVAVAMAIVIPAWAMWLMSYGTLAEDMYVLFSLTMTMIVSVQCIAQHAKAAIAVIAITFVPAIYILFLGQPLLRVMVVDYLFFVGSLLVVHRFVYGDFRRLVGLIEENRELAHTDALTSLPNRRSFLGQLDDRIARADGHSFYVGIIDLDGFKPVNDSLGHGAGDALLCEVSHRLREGKIGFVSRLGGDEFGLIIDSEADPTAIGQAICRFLAKPYPLREGTAQIGASIGFARFPDAATCGPLLLERADFALYHAKTYQRGSAVCYAPEQETSLRSHAAIEQALRRADLAVEFDLVYQPIVDTYENRVLAFEALARWTSPILGPVSPADFIDVAEQTGLIRELSPVLLRKALATMWAWPEDVQLSFNLSAQDIASHECIEILTELVAASGVDPRRIVFEVTETGLMRDLGDARRSLAGLRASGFGIALDDFGTGHSSLSYVHRLPLDRLKIDRSFVTALAEERATISIIQSIVDLSRNLGLHCVVEGVETEEQMLMLRSAGCRSMQGFLFGRPMPASAVAAFVPMEAGRIEAAAG